MEYGAREKRMRWNGRKKKYRVSYFKNRIKKRLRRRRRFKFSHYNKTYQLHDRPIILIKILTTNKLYRAQNARLAFIDLLCLPLQPKTIVCTSTMDISTNFYS